MGIEKHDVLERANYTCAVCNSRVALEFDHVHRLSDNVGTQEFQPLCKDCHHEKPFWNPKTMDVELDLHSTPMFGGATSRAPSYP